MPYAADRHTDSRIASLVMGYKPDPRVPGAFQPIDAGGSPMPMAPPRFSSDIRAAMQVVDQLITDGYSVAMFTTSGEARAKGRWTCAIASDDIGAKSHADTLPLAICRAALAIVDGVAEGS